MSDDAPPDDFWPDVLPLIGPEMFADDEGVRVAEVSQPWGETSHLTMFTALVDAPLAEAILASEGSIGYEVTATGPQPSIGDPAVGEPYVPRFWIWGGEHAPDGVEPLVVGWDSGQGTVVQPDSGFLMTYGLTPQLIKDECQWDDARTPCAGVVRSRPVAAVEQFKPFPPGYVRIRHDYLQDYVSIRQRVLLAVYYAHARGLAGELTRSLAGELGATFELPGRTFALYVVPGEPGVIHARVWGVHRVLDPGPAPITAGRWDYGSFSWPGYDEPITGGSGSPPGSMPKVFVTDTVLGAYEGRPEFEINSESGAVHHGHQWGIGHCRRLGRNVIEVEVRKLYEGTPPDEVRHWHAHAIPPPTAADLSRMRNESNIAQRARRIVFGILSLGEALSRTCSRVLSSPVAPKAMVGLNRGDLEYHGWATGRDVEPTARHVPLGLTKDGFLGRVEDLCKIAAESLQEAPLRRTLLRLGVDADEIKELRSLTLLERLVQLGMVANLSGLELSGDYAEVERRRLEEPPSTDVSVLLALVDLRNLRGHISGTSYAARFAAALEVFGLTEAEFSAGWGTAVDAVYDRVAEAVEAISSSVPSV